MSSHFPAFEVNYIPINLAYSRLNQKQYRFNGNCLHCFVQSNRLHWEAIDELQRKRLRQSRAAVLHERITIPASKELSTFVAPSSSFTQSVTVVIGSHLLYERSRHTLRTLVLTEQISKFPIGTSCTVYRNITYCKYSDVSDCCR